MVKVRAISMGYYEGVKEPGDVFYLDETVYPDLPFWVESVFDVSSNTPLVLEKTDAALTAVKVRAISMGYYEGVKPAGDVFDFKLPFWVELVDVPPVVEAAPTPRKRKASQPLEATVVEAAEDHATNPEVSVVDVDAIDPQAEASQVEPNIEAELSA